MSKLLVLILSTFVLFSCSLATNRGAAVGSPGEKAGSLISGRVDGRVETKEEKIAAQEEMLRRQKAELERQKREIEDLKLQKSRNEELKSFEGGGEAPVDDAPADMVPY